MVRKSTYYTIFTVSNLSAMADTSDDELSIRYPPCGIMKKTGTVKGHF